MALGPDTPRHIKVGDRVAGFVHGMNKSHPDIGAFAEYVVAPADLLLRIPPAMRFEDAASIGLGLYTAGLGLYQELGLAFPEPDPRCPSASSNDEAPFVLVAGGSTATGTRALQLLKRPRLFDLHSAGFRPIATCSPRNFDLVRRFGAEQVFDYGQDDCAATIRAYTRNTLASALDCIATAETTQLCYGALGRAGGRYATVEPFRESVTSQRALTVVPSWLLAVTVFGRKVDLDGEYARPARPQDKELALRLTAYAQTLLDQGQLPTHPVKVVGTGWDSVVRGVATVRKEALSGQKLVCSVA
ncbi:hypothetical protein BD289DRAFT_435485 [Coniella lustricola]|uniref:Enoyl reductase (ER) domain-containing protein n=1 Tax=Coniella lustricola TaxID=2025994 RepID=A0A2T3A6C7_9PEZI|nr:hypothetical protein BD289DRAFT_435485 [Coniella lustricola]